MTSATEQLVGLVGAKNFDVAPDELLAVQLEAANERLQSQIQTIPLLPIRSHCPSLSHLSA